MEDHDQLARDLELTNSMSELNTSMSELSISLDVSGELYEEEEQNQAPPPPPPQQQMHMQVPWPARRRRARYVPDPVCFFIFLTNNVLSAATPRPVTGFKAMTPSRRTATRLLALHATPVKRDGRPAELVAVRMDYSPPRAETVSLSLSLSLSLSPRASAVNLTLAPHLGRTLSVAAWSWRAVHSACRARVPSETALPCCCTLV
ncbi:hypothetical protein ONE63_009589 [Megalurothrips usitatus]|uniref:Uncharacterized protein n=1 Tax=Megalurothrips usitatus TaxID=439358 RepID=A0AAV7XSM3_9NEOP|nr:hypothetical protein ONE63_009589 [Megalurothrips usitatus]